MTRGSPSRRSWLPITWMAIQEIRYQGIIRSETPITGTDGSYKPGFRACPFDNLTMATGDFSFCGGLGLTPRTIRRIVPGAMATPARSARRQFLRGSLVLAGVGLLAGCGATPPWVHQQVKVPRIGFLGATTE